MDEQIELDIYYQGSQEEFLALLYPLHSPNAPQFSKLELSTIEYQPKQQSLEMKYLPAGIENTNRLDKQVVYKSRKINNRTNYFYSLLSQDKKSVVWKNVNTFLQMRPSQQQPYKPPAVIKQQVGYQPKRYQSYDQVMTILSNEPKQTLKYHSPYDQANIIQDMMKQCTKHPLNKNNWRYTKDEYRRCLSK